jgi:branched-chain amino acid transport system permease protein
VTGLKILLDRQHPVVRQGLQYGGAAVAFFLVQQMLWPAPAGVLFQGIIVGSLSVLLAFGLALIYRANRIVNFAQANLGLVPATTALTLIHRGWNYLLAIVVGLLVGAMVGAVVQRVFIHRFFAAPRLILTVVTIGVAQILAAVSTLLIVLLADGNDHLGAPSPVSFTFTISPIQFAGNDALAVVVVPVVIAALLAFLRFSSMGTAIRACADSAERAALLGVNVARVQTVVWVTAGLLSSVGVFLRASSVGGGSVSADGLSLLTRALAAAVIGRMERFGVILAASLGLGFLEQAIL